MNDDEDQRARRTRNYAIALVLFGLVALFFLMTIVRLGIRFGH
jgi:hypothetical protein